MNSPKINISQLIFFTISLRDQHDRKPAKNDKKKLSETKELVDFNKLPLPDIPAKSKKPQQQQLSKGKSSSKDSLPSSTSTTSKIQAKWKQLTEKEYFKKMHYRNSAEKQHKPPTYLFGEGKQQQQKDGVFLNRSGWLQTSQQQQQYSKQSKSKLGELITRSEARKVITTSQQFSKDDNVTILKIDPKSTDTSRKVIMPSSATNDRPGYLPVKSSAQKHGPPPTPILSPPPAFQDENIRNRIMEMRTGTRIQLAIPEHDNKVAETVNAAAKGMVFSRSFEYDSRQKSQTQPATSEAFSRSFDFDFQLNDKSYPYETFLTRFEKTNKFSTLTGVSPNYLTKQPQQPAPATGETFFPKAIPGNNLKLSNPNYYNPNYDNNRRSQFLRPGNGFRSFDSNLAAINNRLASCDSGARSGEWKLTMCNVTFGYILIRFTIFRFLKRRPRWRSKCGRWRRSIVVACTQLQVSAHCNNLSVLVIAQSISKQSSTFDYARDELWRSRVAECQQKQLAEEAIVDTRQETTHARAAAAIQQIIDSQINGFADLIDVATELGIASEHTRTSA